MNRRIITIFLAVFVLGAVICSGEGDAVEKVTGAVCDTDHCKAVAREYSAAMNQSANPCDDFYEFTCGNWKINRPIPDHTPFWTRLAYFQAVVFQRVKEILEEEPEPEDILPVRQAKKWYRSCMNVKKLERRGLQPLESILMQVGGWPMTIDAEEWDEADHSWQRIEQHYFQITGSYIFHRLDFLYFNNSIIDIIPGPLPLVDKLPLKFETYTGEEYENYKNFITAVTLLFVKHNSANVSLEMIDKDVKDLIEFEKQLSEIPAFFKHGIESIDDYEVRYNNQIEKKSNQINVRNLIKRFLDMVNLDAEVVKFISYKNKDYHIKLNELMNKTPKRTIVNYIHWNFLSSMLTATTEKMRDYFFELMKNEFGIKAREPRWLECTKEVKMTHAIAYAFANKFYSEETDRDVRKMVDNIKAEMKDHIKASKWLDEDTKSMTVNKLSTMELYVGVPDWFKNATYVLNSYRGLIIGVNHFDNILSFKRYEDRLYLRDTISGGKLIKAEMVNPLEINAAYEYSENSMSLPAADFQPPFFTKNLPNNINYGMSGTVIGHEIGHAYDINGITTGIKEGEKNVPKEIIDIYKKRAECFLDQYNNYYGVTEPPVPAEEGEESLGRRTLAENMADTTGVNAVFQAYKSLLKTNGPDTKLPGFEKYSDEQMFFISFASLWCSDSTEKYEETRKSIDEHSANNLRANGAVSNSKDFAQVFNCPAGSPMNPQKKCNIWEDIEEIKRKRRKRNQSGNFAK